MNKDIRKQLNNMGCSCLGIHDAKLHGSMVTFKCENCTLCMRKKEFIKHFPDYHINRKSRKISLYEWTLLAFSAVFFCGAVILYFIDWIVFYFK